MSMETMDGILELMERENSSSIFFLVFPEYVKVKMKGQDIEET